jgi:hypothetical protein
MLIVALVSSLAVRESGAVCSQLGACLVGLDAQSPYQETERLVDNQSMVFNI